MEIKPQNLRVGNLIYDHECEPHIFEVEEIKKNNQGLLAVYYRNGSCMATEVDGVVLSEELLVNRFGFVKAEMSEYFIKNITADRVLKINNINEKVHLWLKDKFSTQMMEYVFLSHTDYAHQLQNIFQDFTETELTTK